MKSKHLAIALGGPLIRRILKRQINEVRIPLPDHTLAIGDRVLVREQWAPACHLIHPTPACDPCCAVAYRADMSLRECSPRAPDIAMPDIALPDDRLKMHGLQWRNAKTLPLNACRLSLTIRSMRVERLQDITGAGLAAEGMDTLTTLDMLELGVSERKIYGLIAARGMVRATYPMDMFCSLADTYSLAWNAQHPRLRWETNPDVLVLKF